MAQHWTVLLHPEVTSWILSLDDSRHDRVEAAIDMLAENGPALGRPLVDSVSGSRHTNLKELRVGTCRILFAFDRRRRAVLVVAGDKSGRWSDWYRANVPIADERLDHWLNSSAGWAR